MLEKVLRDVQGSYYVADNVRVDEDAFIGNETRLWNDVVISRGAKLGAHCVIGAGVHIERDVVVGDYCKIQRGATLYKGLILGDYVFIGPNATTTNDRNPRSFGDWSLTETIIETGASIGANSTLIAGNRIGALALIGAGSVVTRDILPGQAVAGNPARFMGWVDVSGKIVSRDQDNMPDVVSDALKDPESAIKEYIIQGSHSE